MADIFDEKSVLNRNKIYDVPEGTIILNEGEVNRDMYKVVSGHVEMYTGYGTDNEILIGMLGPGSCFGEFGLLTGRPAIYTIITYSDTKILRVTEALMSDFMVKNPDSILQIMRNMANNMMKLQHQVNQFSRELAEQRGENIEAIAELLAKENLKNYVLTSEEDAGKKEGMHGKLHFLNGQWK